VSWPIRLLIAYLCIALAAGCAPGLGDSEADLVLEDVVLGTGASRLKARTPTPSITPWRYTVQGRSYAADVYRSPEGSLGGLVLVPGVSPQGKDDPRLGALAMTLARMRFTVLVPDLPGPRRYQVRASDVRAVADAFVALTTLTDEVAPGQAGIAGISYGAGPVLLAGLEPDIREQLGFIITLGGYYDLRSVVTFFTTGHYRQEETDAWRRLDVPPAAARVFTLSNLGLLEAPEDRRRIRAHLMDLAAGRSDAAPPADLAPDAQALVALLHNDDPARVPALIEALSPQIRTELAGLDPAAHDLGALRARVLLIHGRADTIIPYTESLALARHLKAVLPPDQVDLFLIDGFAHVDFRVGPQDVPELRRAAETLLGQRATP
jgi:pimeloyl-ACP methyl ester carboxylesterase